MSGEFTCSEEHQGYDRMVHGGILAAIVDASMAQCLMGHGIAGYTTDLNLRYCKPVLINQPVTITTTLEDVNIGKLYTLKSIVVQYKQEAVKATGRFFKKGG